MNRIPLILMAVLLPFTALAGDKVKGTNFFVVEAQNWETGKGTGYWIWHGKGVSHSIEGPLGTDSVDCHGAGFWDKDGSWGEGICVNAAGDDSRTSSWKKDRGQKVGQWKILTGTGKFAGIKGGGSYIPTRLPEGRHMSEWEGEITLAK
jgi:hypothetical protein